MKKYTFCILALLCFCSAKVMAQFTADDFIITVNTTATSTGSSANNQYTIPAEGSYSVYYESVPAGISGSAPVYNGNLCTSCPKQTITFPYAGVYKIGLRPTGSNPLWHYVNSISDDKLKLLTIEQWGTTKWSTLNAMFSGCANLTSMNATDIPDMTVATDAGFMFHEALNFTGGNSMNSWQTGHILDMSYMFWVARKFNQNISKWNTTAVTNMKGMFKDAVQFNQPIGNWNTGKVSDFRWAFDGAVKFNQSLNSWNVTTAYSTYSMFNGAAAFNQSLSNWKLNAIQDAGLMFANSGMDCNNYSKTLIGWAGSVPRFSYTVSFNNQQNRTYGTAGQTARNILINDKGWNITGDTYDAGCKVVPDPQVFPFGGNPVNGTITKNTYLLGVQPPKYVKRIYEITPTNNPTTTTGKVFLYFSNQDFTSYNSQVPAPANLLPDINNPATIEARKANLLIEKRGGVSTDGSGLPGSYTGSVETINPDDLSIVWDSDAAMWEVSFNVTGFSGFFVKTSEGALPVDFGTLSAILKNNQLYVSWRTATETNNSHFEIEISADGKNFTKIGRVSSKAENGTSDKPLSYEFVTDTPTTRMALGLLGLALLISLALAGKKKRSAVLALVACCLLVTATGLPSCSKQDQATLSAGEKLFIRIKQVDKDGTARYSQTVLAKAE